MDKFGITLENIMTPDECKELIATSEKMGFEEAMVNTMPGF
jgi:hypothetical protein